jgi:hypothetical protein
VYFLEVVCRSEKNVENPRISGNSDGFEPEALPNERNCTHHYRNISSHIHVLSIRKTVTKLAGHLRSTRTLVVKTLSQRFLT